MSNNLQGKTALVTGGSRGFGRSIVEALAGQGMQVVAVARGQPHLDALKKEVGGNIKAVSADVTDPIAAARTMRQVQPQVLVLNAGALPLFQPVHHLSWDSFSLHWQTDVKGVFLWAREALLMPLPARSRIIVVSSGAGIFGSGMSGGYAPAKAALWQLSKNLADAGRPYEIEVQCLFPTLTPATELGQSAVTFYANQSGLSEESFLERIGTSTAFTPARVGESVVQLLSDPDAYTATGYLVNGEGLTPVTEGIIQKQ